MPVGCVDGHWANPGSGCVFDGGVFAARNPRGFMGPMVTKECHYGGKLTTLRSLATFQSIALSLQRNHCDRRDLQSIAITPEQAHSRRPSYSCHLLGQRKQARP